MGRTVRNQGRCPLAALCGLNDENSRRKAQNVRGDSVAADSISSRFANASTAEVSSKNAFHGSAKPRCFLATLSIAMYRSLSGRREHPATGDFHQREFSERAKSASFVWHVVPALFNEQSRLRLATSIE
jgi:hypothetical protein